MALMGLVSGSIAPSTTCPHYTQSKLRPFVWQLLLARYHSAQLDITGLETASYYAAGAKRIALALHLHRTDSWIGVYCLLLDGKLCLDRERQRFVLEDLRSFNIPRPVNQVADVLLYEACLDLATNKEEELKRVSVLCDVTDEMLAPYSQNAECPARHIFLISHVMVNILRALAHWRQGDRQAGKK